MVSYNPNVNKTNFTTKKGSKEMVELAKKGGSVKSDKKTLAAQLRGLSMVTSAETRSKAINRIIQLLENPKLSESNLLLYCDEVRKSELKSGDKIKLLDSMTKIHSAIHGSKELRLNVNVEKDTAQQLFDSVFNDDPAEEESEESSEHVILHNPIPHKN